MCSPAPYLPDWVGTTVVFNLGHDEHGQCALPFHHHGFNPALDCYDICQRSWDHYLPSLRDYITTGTGSPLGSEGDTAWRHAGKATAGRSGLSHRASVKGARECLINGETGSSLYE